MLPIFKDKKMQSLFEQDGYVRLKLFTPAQITVLRDYYDTVRQQHEQALQSPSLYSSIETGDPEMIIAVDKVVKATVMQQVEATFQNYQTLVSNYLIKASGDETELMPHQDLTFVNEPEECSFNLWIPLQRTDAASGQLRVLKGSHRIRQTLRVVPGYPRPFVRFQDTIRELFTDIETDIGECVVIDHSLIHGSSVNRTGSPRVAVILGMCSAPAAIHYYYMPDGDSDKIEKYRMTARDYYHFRPDGRPMYAPLSAIISHSFEHTSEKVFKDWIRRDHHLGLLSKMKLLHFRSLQKEHI